MPRLSRCATPDARCPVPDAQCPASGARSPASGARRPVPGASVRADDEVLVQGIPRVRTGLLHGLHALRHRVVGGAYALRARHRTEPVGALGPGALGGGLGPEQGGVGAVVARFEHALHRAVAQDGQTPLAELRVVPLDAVQPRTGLLEIRPWHRDLGAGQVHGDGTVVGAAAVPPVREAQAKCPAGRMVTHPSTGARRSPFATGASSEAPSRASSVPDCQAQTPAPATRRSATAASASTLLRRRPGVLAPGTASSPSCPTAFTSSSSPLGAGGDADAAGDGAGASTPRPPPRDPLPGVQPVPDPLSVPAGAHEGGQDIGPGQTVTPENVGQGAARQHVPVPAKPAPPARGRSSPTAL